MMLALEYDGEQHRVDPVIYAYDIQRSEDLDELGWTRLRVVKANTAADVFADLTAPGARDCGEIAESGESVICQQTR